MSEEPDALLDQKIGNYQIFRRLGKGGMGIVYQARQLTLDRFVAIKFLSSHLAENEEYVQRFLREAQAAARLSHPHIISVFDAGSQDGVYYFVMEYVEGQNIATLLKGGKVYGEVEAVGLIRQAADALAYAHREGIVHRDIKPENLMLGGEGRIKVGDLGLAKWTSQGDGSLTASGVVLGTPFYISPEQVRDSKNADHRMDIYSLGATLFHMVTGQLPYQGQSAVEIMSKHLTESTPSARALRSDLSEGFCEVLLKMMAKDAKDRFQSMSEVDAALAGIGKEDPGATTRVEKPSESAMISRNLIPVLKKKMKEGAELPSMSRTITIINKLTSVSDEESLAELTNTVLNDIALTNKLLKLVNTVFYSSYTGKISTISRAIMVLGLAQVKNAALSLMLFENLQNQSLENDVKDATMHAFMSGSIARDVALKMGLVNAEEVFICSAFYNLGRLLIAFHMPEEHHKVVELIQAKQKTEDEATVLVLGATYEEIGGEIAKEWNFPDDIAYAMKGFAGAKIPKPETMQDQMRGVVCFSNELCQKLQHAKDLDSRNEVFANMSERYKNCVPIEPGQMGGILNASVKEAGRYARVLDINMAEGGIFKRMGIVLPQSPAESKVVPPKAPAPPSKDLDMQIATDLGLLMAGGDADASSSPDAILSRGIQDVTESLLEKYSISQILHMVLEVMYRALGFQRALICIRNAKRGVMEARHGFGSDIDVLLKLFQFPIQGSSDLFNQSLKQNADIMVRDIREKKVEALVPEWYRTNVAAGTFMLLPIVVKQVAIGLIYVDKVHAGEIHLTAEQMNYLKTLRNQAVLAIRNAASS